MKKTVSILLLLALCLALAGCAGASAEPEKKELSVEEVKELVLELKGQPIDELLEIIGEPLSREYAPSCLVQGGEDGVLTYDGYTVYTLVSADGAETVYDIE